MIWTDKIEEAKKTQFSMEDCKFAELNIKSLIGDEWFDQQLNKPIVKRHPLLHRWTSTGAPSIIYLVSLSKDLEIVNKCEGFLPILIRLKDEREFESARYEIFLSAAFMRSGAYQKLEFSPSVNNNFADFRLKLNDNWIYIECTKMQQSQEEKEFHSIYHNINKGISKILNNRRIYYCDIRIHLTQEFEKRSIKELIETVDWMIHKYSMSYMKKSQSNFILEIVPLRPRLQMTDLTSKFSIGIFKEDTNIRTEIDFDEDGNPYSSFTMTPNVIVKDPFKIIAEKPISKDENSRIKNKLDGVSKQLPEDGVNIVCMGMTPYQYADKIFSLVSDEYFTERFNKRIGGIILTRENVSFPEGPMDFLEITFIRNPYARKPTPTDSIKILPLCKNGMIQYSRSAKPEQPYYQLCSISWNAMVLDLPRPLSR